MRFRLIGLFAAAVIGASIASAQTSTIHSKHQLSVASSANMRRIPPRSALTRNDLTFMKNAAIANMAEIQLGQLAQRNGAEWGRGFGKDMEREHTIALAGLKKIAHENGVTLPSGIDKKHQRLYDRLSRLHGMAFDNAYRAAMIDGHKAVLNALHQEMQNGHNSAVREYAVMLEPGVKMHHRMAIEKTTMMHHG
jgi:putative membrane protein